MSINLTKGQKVELNKADGTALSAVFMGLGWDAATAGGGFLGGLLGGGNSGGSIDLDASVGMFDENKTLVDTVSFSHLTSRDGSIRHSGDNLTGAGHGDDEVIHVNLSTVPANVKSLVFVVNSFRGQTFDKVKNCFCRLVDSVNNTEICIYKLDEKGTTNTGLIMAKLYRHNNAWKMSAVGLPCNGTTIQSILPTILTVL